MKRFNSTTAISVSLKNYHSMCSRSRRRRLSQCDGNISKIVIPPELSKSVVKLNCESNAKGGICDVYLIGTTHYTQNSMIAVRDVMTTVKPQVVFLELCHSRANAANLYEGIKTEWGVASEEAKKYGSEVILGDRPYHITRKRLHAKMYRMPYWQMAKVSFTMLLDFVFMLCPKSLTKKSWNFWDVYKRRYAPYGGRLSVCWEELLARNVPAWRDVFTTERDQYMSAKILEVARKRKSVLAVVGKGHLPGIQKYWKQPIKVEQLLSTTYEE